MPPPRPTGRVSYDHSGRVVAVTGGSGGIGQAICHAFAASGASVVALDIAPPPATTEAASGAAAAPSIGFQRVDVSREAECQAAVDQIMAQHGGLDVLVNTAAIQPPSSYAPMHDFPGELWERMIAINLSGYAYMAKYALRCMLAQQAGVIVNIASAQAHRTAREVAAYGPTKGGNLMQAMQWGVEYARHGIRVVSVSPGAINTPLLRASLEEQGGGEALANRHPLGRLGEPEEVANAILWLASGDASFITATDLLVDGGLNALGAFAEPYRLDSMPRGNSAS
jgi:NAD(P)-dependent dehydrogenase (short-subunit alcohol dehydrogenase family)